MAFMNWMRSATGLASGAAGGGGTIGAMAGGAVAGGGVAGAFGPGLQGPSVGQMGGEQPPGQPGVGGWAAWKQRMGQAKGAKARGKGWGRMGGPIMTAAQRIQSRQQGENPAGMQRGVAGNIVNRMTEMQPQPGTAAQAPQRQGMAHNTAWGQPAMNIGEMAAGPVARASSYR